MVKEAGITRLGEADLLGIDSGASLLNEKPPCLAGGSPADLEAARSLDDLEGVLSLAIIGSVFSPIVSALFLAATDDSFSLVDDRHGMAKLGGFSQDAAPKFGVRPEAQPD